MVSVVPKRTVYLRNLPDKIKDEELKRSLYGLFSQFGPILEIITRNNVRTRGQAWVVFQGVASAASAVRQMSNHLFYDKQIKISFAKVDADAVPKMLGTYKPGMVREVNVARSTTYDNNKRQPAKQQSFVTATDTVKTKADSSVENDANNILLLINLPADTDEKKLQVVFGQLPGLKEVRLIQNRHDVAFVEFEEIAQATQAKNSLQGYMIDQDHPMKIIYAKN